MLSSHLLMLSAQERTCRMSGTLRFYIDGSLAYERLGVIMNMSTMPLQFAGGVSSAYPGGGSASDGFLDLDELRIYNVPLSSEDVLALANASDGGVADRNQAPGAPIGIAIGETSNPAVFTVEQGSFATAPIPPKFHIDGGQWRRTNRGQRPESFASLDTLEVCSQPFHFCGSVPCRRHSRGPHVQLGTTVETWRNCPSMSFASLFQSDAWHPDSGAMGWFCTLATCQGRYAGSAMARRLMPALWNLSRKAPRPQ